MDAELRDAIRKRIKATPYRYGMSHDSELDEMIRDLMGYKSGQEVAAIARHMETQPWCRPLDC